MAAYAYLKPLDLSIKKRKRECSEPSPANPASQHMQVFEPDTGEVVMDNTDIIEEVEIPAVEEYEEVVEIVESEDNDYDDGASTVSAHASPRPASLVESRAGEPEASTERVDSNAAGGCYEAISPYVPPSPRARAYARQWATDVRLPISNYQVIRKLGKGAFGRVHQAMDLRHRRKVALKTVDVSGKSDAIARYRSVFGREVAALMTCNGHPNVVDIYGYGRGNDLFEYHITMECCSSDLAKEIGKWKQTLQGPKTDLVRKWMRQMLEGIEFVHGRGIVHRDLKPANILLSNDGRIKIADFGLARFTHDKTPVTPQMVTLWYRAPEILLDLDYEELRPVDVWSLACIFAELACLKAPFMGKSVQGQLRLIFEIVGTPYTWPRYLSSQYYREIEQQAYEGEPLKRMNYFLMLGTSATVAHGLFEKMMQCDPEKRITPSQALCLEFFRM